MSSLRTKRKRPRLKCTSDDVKTSDSLCCSYSGGSALTIYCNCLKIKKMSSKLMSLACINQYYLSSSCTEPSTLSTRGDPNFKINLKRFTKLYAADRISTLSGSQIQSLKYSTFAVDLIGFIYCLNIFSQAHCSIQNELR